MYYLLPIIFACTAFHALYKKLYLYALSWFGLAFTTLIWHNTKPGCREAFWIYDCFFIITTIALGLYYFIMIKGSDLIIDNIIIISFITTIFLHFAEPIKNYTYKFYLIHTIAVIGHNLIIHKIKTPLPISPPYFSINNTLTTLQIPVYKYLF